MSDNVLIRAEGVRKSFNGKEVLKGIDLEIRRGEVVVIIGLRKEYVSSLPESFGSANWRTYLL